MSTDTSIDIPDRCMSPDMAAGEDSDVEIIEPPPTKKPKLKRSNATVTTGPQSRRWVFTINNPDPEQDKEDCLNWNAKYLVFQLEKGEKDGTLHYQGEMFSNLAELSYSIVASLE